MFVAYGAKDKRSQGAHDEAHGKDCERTQQGKNRGAFGGEEQFPDDAGEKTINGEVEPFHEVAYAYREGSFATGGCGWFCGAGKCCCACALHEDNLSVDVRFGHGMAPAPVASKGRGGPVCGRFSAFKNAGGHRVSPRTGRGGWRCTGRWCIQRGLRLRLPCRVRTASRHRTERPHWRSCRC